MTSRTENVAGQLLSVGTPVEVLTRIATWARGLRVERVGQRGYVLRRSLHGQVLPVAFGFERVRATGLHRRGPPGADVRQPSWGHDSG